MNGTLSLRNRQRACRVDLRLLRQIIHTLLLDLMRLENFDLGVYLVGTPQITRLNETFLHHSGGTDVIAFDYSEQRPAAVTSRSRVSLIARAARLQGEVFVCPDAAMAQARRFRSSWQRELVRYIVHGILHLRGHDDLEVRARRRMKREEDQLVRLLAGRFAIAGLAPAGQESRLQPTGRPLIQARRKFSS